MADPFDNSKRGGLDTMIEEALVGHRENYEISQLKGVKPFPVLARRQCLKRFLAHAEFFKQTLDWNNVPAGYVVKL